MTFQALQFPTIADSVIMQIDAGAQWVGAYVHGEKAVIQNGKTWFSENEYLYFNRTLTHQHLLSDNRAQALTLRRFTSTVSAQNADDPAHRDRLDAIPANTDPNFYQAIASNVVWNQYPPPLPPPPPPPPPPFPSSSVSYETLMTGHRVFLNLVYTEPPSGRILTQVRWFIQVNPNIFRGILQGRLPLEPGAEEWSLTLTASPPNLNGWYYETWPIPPQ